jgi:hypothetical protein
MGTTGCVSRATADHEQSVNTLRGAPPRDKGYDTRAHVEQLRDLGVTPHVAQNDKNRRSAIDDRTTTHVSYEISQRERKAVEQVFGWGKTVGPLRKVKHRGKHRVGWMFTFTQAAYNLVRMRPLLCPA